ncbi:hypothetical protein FBY35_0152 [Streptomyces sp. SLBN-118]|uniref:hypothetical protein n=1 Tax=Streptomyces sp. SLBN-118 TaxID=2768454 RepID=UPI0011521FAD|nr:hypothetical protein [Streptomyces sp. SLBN-118]TQK49876.1 hypothetical protein FBY35_0152 [Streptomyces sp. SLBN-118]
MKLSMKSSKPVPEDRQMLTAGLTMAAEMITENAADSLREGRWSDAVADLAEAARRTQVILHEAIERALAEGQTLANDAHLSPEYLRQAYKQFDRGTPAQSGPDQQGREPWRVLG